jgi:hypothetical protein
MPEWRSDIAQLACSLFLLLEGPGPWSLDAALRSSGGQALQAAPSPPETEERASSARRHIAAR